MASAAGKVEPGPAAAINRRMTGPETYLRRASEAFRQGDPAAGLAALREGLGRHDGHEILSLALGRALRTQRQLAAAREVLEAGLAQHPGSRGLTLELAEVEVAEGEGAPALQRVQPLMAGPPDPTVLSVAAGAYRVLGDRMKAAQALEAALALRPADAGLWSRREILARDGGDMAEVLAVLARALEALPQDVQVRSRRIQALAEAGRASEAAQALRTAIQAEPDAGWAHLQLGRLLQETDRTAANAHLRRAVALGPDDVGAVTALAYSLKETRGEDEAVNLQEAVELILRVLPRLPPSASAIAADLLWRTGHYEAVEQLGGFAELGRYWAQNGAPTALLQQFARVETDADRVELVAQHRIWGERAARPAAERPIARPPRPAGERIRLGFLSSDLRAHAVGYFVEPLFAHADPRFELHAYSAFPGPADEAQRWFAGEAAAFRDIGPLSDREAAQRIAADGLDILVELGGTTQHSRPGVLPYRPAPLQASWLGYPHSLGLSAIDRFVADPWITPPRSELLIEQPLVMPQSWICMAPRAFPDAPAVDPALPAERTGAITFGTANNSYKFNPRLLRTWARTVAAVPGSRFMIVRPEAGSPSFQANVARHFAEQGVGAERLVFRATRGRFATLYADMDIALDTFPQTGGTTTCEALWMGVPTVSLAGEAVYERLSLSILQNAGLGELVASDADGYVRIAVDLARDRPRLAELRRTLRDRIKASPLGDAEAFAADFYALLAGAVEG